jgi:hypothetical protein
MMGYDSSIDCSYFRSTLTLDALNVALKLFIEDLRDEEKQSYMEGYDFMQVSTKNAFNVFALANEDYGRHYGDLILAQFISTVIAKGEHATLEFVGEDNLPWGYVIITGEVYNIEYWIHVDGMTLEEFLKKKGGKN